MKICIINNLFPPYQVGGAEKSAALLADALVRAGHRVSVITLRPAGKEGLSISPNGLRVHGVPLENIYWPYAGEEKPPPLYRAIWHMRASYNRAAARRVAAILELEQPDLVHAMVLTGFSVAVLDEVHKQNIPLVQTIQDYSMLCARSTLYRAGRGCAQRCVSCRLLTWPNKGALSKADSVTYVSEYVRQAHERFGFGRKSPSEILYYVVDPASDVLRPAAEGDSPVLNFGYIGRVEPEKGIEVVLRALSTIRSPDWRLKIAGRGEATYVSRLQAEYRDARIEWLGFVSPDAFYRSVDVVLAASTWPEPLPRVIIEAFSYGKSVICSTAGGIPEVAGRGAVVATYEPNDVDALAGLLDGALSEPGRWRGGGPLHSHSLDPFQEEGVVAQCTALFAKAKDRAGRRRGG